VRQRFVRVLSIHVVMVLSIGRKYPFATALGTATVKTAAADALTQRCIEQREELDVRRLAFFTGFGFAYLGGFQYMLYVRLFGRLFPHAAGIFSDRAVLLARLTDRQALKELFLQVGIGNFIHIPFVFLPAFYLVQEVCEKGTTTSPRHAICKYAENCKVGGQPIRSSTREQYPAA